MTVTVDEYNVIVNGVPLINTWRKSVSGIVTGRDSQGTVKMAGIEFLISGDTEQELAERLRQTEREFNQINPRAYGYRTADGTDGVNRLFDYHTGDGESVSVYSAVSMVPQDTQTRWSYYMYLEITCDMVLKQPGGIPRPGEQPDAPIEGLAEAILLTTVYDGGDTKTIAADGLFRTILEDTTVGPVNIVNITDAGGANAGLAKVTLASDPGAFPADSYVEITGTALFNGRHAVKSKTGTAVILETPLITPDTTGGKLSAGEVQKAQDLYETAKPAIYALMGVGSNNITLVHKIEKDNGDGTFEFILTAQEQEWVPIAEAADDSQLVKTSFMKVTPVKVENYESSATYSALGAGTAPTRISAEGTLVINRRNMTTTLIGHWDATLKAAVLARIATNAGGAITPERITIVLDGNTPSISFVIESVLTSTFNGTLMLEVTRSKKVPSDAYIYSRGAGLHGIQFKKGLPVEVYTRTYTRLGKTLVDLSQIGAPVETGYYFHLHDSDDVESGPKSYDQLGTDLYHQTRTEIWLKLKLV